MKHLGSITEINGAEIEKVDCITFGAPCQDLSIAGKRKGMKHTELGDDETTRSGLFFEAIRLIKEMREDDRKNGRPIRFLRPRYAVYENVAGAFTSNKGRDWQAVLTEIVRIADPTAPDVPMPQSGKWPHAGELHDEMGRWSVAWRLIDAQFWGVPQRRKRVALVADFASGGVSDILFEQYLGAEPESEIQPFSEGLPRDIKQSTETREGTSSAVGESTPKTGGGGGNTYDIRISSDGTKNWRAHCYETDISRALDTGGEDPDSNHGGVAIMQGIGGETAGTLDASYYKGCGERQGIERDVVYGICSYASNSMKSPNPNSGIYKADTARTLDNNGGSPDCHQGGMAVVCLNDQGGGVMNVSVEKTATLRAQTHGHEPIVMGVDAYNQSVTGEVSKSLTNKATDSDHTPIVCLEGNGSRDSHKGDGYKGSETMYTLNTVEQLTMEDYKVRRLTVTECELLQGFPSGWTDIGEWTDSKGKKRDCSDSSRYKALGNSIAVPFWFWLLRRISAQYTRQATLGSLFDGIGGFPLAWEMCNGKSTARWASEIEEFPIAVTKKRFPETDEGGVEDMSDPVYSFTVCNSMAMEKEVTGALLARDYKDPPTVFKKE